MSDRSLKLGIFGFGCVGQGLYETLNASGFTRAEVVKVCIKHANKKRNAPAELFTTKPEELLNNPEIDVIVELIDDAQAAYSFVTTALKKGKAVVTANKKLIAEHLEELILLQKETNRPLLYEAACCASIPVIRNLEEYYDNDLVNKVEGILNGSTNYILSNLETGGKTYDEALAEAQALGFAESDPTLDVEGFDPKYKLTLLLAHAFGIVAQPEDIPHLGITSISKFALQRAVERNQKIKLVGKCWKDGDTVRACVLPTLIDADEELSQVRFENNGVVVEGAFSERQFFQGKGAGSWPTGAAVLSDISALTYDYRYAYKKINQKRGLKLAHDFPVWIQLSGQGKDALPLYAFEEVLGTYRGPQENYVEGKIGIRNLLALLQEGPWCAIALSAATAKQYQSITEQKEFALI